MRNEHTKKPVQFKHLRRTTTTTLNNNNPVAVLDGIQRIIRVHAATPQAYIYEHDRKDGRKTAGVNANRSISVCPSLCVFLPTLPPKDKYMFFFIRSSRRASSPNAAVAASPGRPARVATRNRAKIRRRTYPAAARRAESVAVQCDVCWMLDGYCEWGNGDGVGDETWLAGGARVAAG